MKEIFFFGLLLLLLDRARFHAVIQFELRREQFVYSFCSAESHLTASCVRYGQMLTDTTSFQLKPIANRKTLRALFSALSVTCCRRDAGVVGCFFFLFFLIGTCHSLYETKHLISISLSALRHQTEELKTRSMYNSRVKNITKYKMSILPF